MMAINFALAEKTKELAARMAAGCCPLSVGLAQTEVIINARHARLFRDLCVENPDRAANNVNVDGGIQNDARPTDWGTYGNGLCNAASTAAAAAATPGTSNTL